MGFIKKLLMRIARAVLQQVINQIQGLVNEALETVLNPVNAIIQEIVGGDTWRGAGANAFVEELQSILVPDVDRLIRSGERGCQSLISAEQIMSQADKDVSRLVDGFGDLVSGIY